MAGPSRGSWFVTLGLVSSVVMACGSEDAVMSASGGSTSGGSDGSSGGSTSGGSTSGGSASPSGGASGEGGKASGAGGSAGKGGAGQAGSSSGGGGGGASCEPITTFETGLAPQRILHVATSGSPSA